jgi:exopolysaccharide biosynthesis protein
MKKWILSAACICCINGFAAAQNNTSKAITKTEHKTLKKGKEAKQGTTKKSEETAISQKDFAVTIPKPAGTDSAFMPKAKQED